MDKLVFFCIRHPLSFLARETINNIISEAFRVQQSGQGKGEGLNWTKSKLRVVDSSAQGARMNNKLLDQPITCYMDVGSLRICNNMKIKLWTLTKCGLWQSHQFGKLSDIVHNRFYYHFFQLLFVFIVMICAKKTDLPYHICLAIWH